MVKNQEFEPKLTNKNAKKGYKATKKGLKPIFSWYQTYTFNMSRNITFNTISYPFVPYPDFRTFSYPSQNKRKNLPFKVGKQFDLLLFLKPNLRYLLTNHRHHANQIVCYIFIQFTVRLPLCIYEDQLYKFQSPLLPFY